MTEGGHDGNNKRRALAKGWYGLLLPRQLLGGGHWERDDTVRARHSTTNMRKTFALNSVATRTKQQPHLDESPSRHFR